MTLSWPQIRGLSYSTIGRTLRATVHGSDGATSIWYAPPARWRIERPDGTPQYIENESDEYRFREDGVAVHASKAPNRMVSTLGLSPTLLFTAHRMWPVPGPMAQPQVGAAGEPVEVDVRGRRGWQIEFADLRGGSPISVVIDAESGVALSWRQDDKWLEMSNPVIDEEFDSQLFAWNGASIETEEQLESQEQREHEQKMREVAAMPPTTFGWLPTEVHVSALDGDPLSGALESTATVSSTQVGLRRWLTEVGEPEVSFMLDHWPSVARKVLGSWTVELRAYNAVSDEDSQRIFSSLTLPDPPGSPITVRKAVAARQSLQIEAEIVERLGTGRDLDDCVRIGYQSLFIRTDFTDDARWREVVLAAMTPVESNIEGFPPAEAGLTCIDHRNNDGMTPQELVDRLAGDSPYYAFLADSITMSHNEMPILALDCGRPDYGHEPGRTFRIIPSEMYSVEANWSISNMGFGDFADSADDDGIFRGFPPSPPVVTTLHRDELIELAASNQSTAALVRFAAEIAELESAFAVVYETPRDRLHDFVVDLDDASGEIRVGVDDYLSATAGGGTCHSGFVQIRGGHWSFVINPDNGTLEAVMLRQFPPSETE